MFYSVSLFSQAPLARGSRALPSVLLQKVIAVPSNVHARSMIRSALLLVETVEGLSAATLLILQAGKITLTHRTEVLGSYACFPCFLSY